MRIPKDRRLLWRLASFMLHHAHTKRKAAQVFERRSDQLSSPLAHNNLRSDDIMKSDITAYLNNALVFSLPVQPVQPGWLHASAQMMQ